MIRKKLFFRLSLILVLLFAWMFIGHALQLIHFFAGTFDSRTLSRQPFLGDFQYYTTENAELQNNILFRVRMGNDSPILRGTSLFAAFSPDTQVCVHGGFITYPFNEYTLFAGLNVPGISLNHPFPLDSLVDDTSSFYNPLYEEVNSGNLDYLQGYSPVPEPATMFLLGFGFLVLAGLGRKRFKKNK